MCPSVLLANLNVIQQVLNVKNRAGFAAKTTKTIEVQRCRFALDEFTNFNFNNDRLLENTNFNKAELTFLGVRT